MKYKIGYDQNFDISKLLNVDELSKHNIEIFPIEANKLGELFLLRRLDAILGTPLDYSLGITNSDFRVIPIGAYALHNFSNTYTITFNKGLKTIKLLNSAKVSNYIANCTKILLNEKFGMSIELTNEESSINDGYIANSNNGEDATLDLTEEWFMAFEQIFPVYFWIARHEKENLELVNSLKLLNIPNQDEQITNEDHTREGQRVYQFNEEIEKSIDDTLELFYYTGICKEIGHVKLFDMEFEN